MRFIHVSKLNIIASTLAFCVMLSGGVPAQAQGYQPFSGTVNVLNTNNQPLGFDGTNLLQIAVDSAWNQLIPGLEAAINNDTGVAVDNAIGRTIRNPVCRLSPRGTLQITAAGANTFSLQYVIYNNSEDFYVTTPNGIPGSLDPHFSVTFDIVATATVSVGTTGVTIQSAAIHVANAKIDSQNVIADLVKDADSIIRAFGGTGFFIPAERRLDAQSFALQNSITLGLGNLNQFLGGLISQGYSQIRALTQPAGNGAQALNLLISKANVPQLPTTGSGTISGVIRWNKSDGYPAVAGGQSYSTAFVVQAQVRQAASASTPQAPNSFGYDNSQQVGTARVMPAVETATQYECQYQITNLPTGVPVYVMVSFNGQWQAASNVSFTPVGWPGYVTLQQSQTLVPYRSGGPTRTSAFAQAEPQSQTATGPGAHSQMRAPSSDRRYGPPTIQQQGRTPVYSGRTENAPLNPNSQVAKVPVNPPQVSGANATGFDFQLVHGVVLH